MIIYLTTNTINGKKYIGKDRNNLKSYLGGGTDLNRDIKKYGRNNFKKEILENCLSIEELNQREIYWLEYFDAALNPLFYNKTNKSYGRTDKFTKTEAYQNRGEKISKSNKGKSKPEYWKNSLQLKEHGKNLGNSNKGKPKPSGFGEKLSKQRKGKISPLKGKPHTSNYKSVICMDDNRNIIKEYTSQIEAEKDLNIAKGTVSKGIKKGYRIGGYFWRFKE
jgi:group I intron endonuclease